MDFWQTLPGLILSWSAAIAGIAAGLKGISYLLVKARDGGSLWMGWWDERRRVRRVMAELTSAEGWPNGSETMRESHQAVYDKLSTIGLDMTELKKSVEQALIDRG